MLEKLRSIEGLLSLLNLIVLVLLLWKLHATGLRQRYRALFGYLAIEVFTAAILLSVPWRSNLYAMTYFVREALILLAAITVVYEVYTVVLAPLPAISAACRKAILVLFPCTAAIALLTTVLDTEVLPRQSLIIHRVFTIERVMDINILLFLLAMTIVMLWFPMRMRRNVVLYISGFVAYFLTRSCGLLLANILPQQNLRLVSNSLMAISLGCFLFFLVGLRKEYEEQFDVTGHRWNPAVMQRLSDQLSHINSALARLDQ